MSAEPLQRPVDTPTEWFRFAAENLAVAERELTYEEPAFHTICFLCQSAAEKYLKGFLIAQGWTLERTHDIVVLLGLCADYAPAFSDLLPDGANAQERTLEELLASLRIGAEDMLATQVPFEPQATMVTVDVPPPAWAAG